MKSGSEKQFASASTSIASSSVLPEEVSTLPKGLGKPVQTATASSNLMKALKQQNDVGYTEVETFLESAGGLGKYRDLFIDNGIEDLETILEMDDKHLE